MVVRFLYVDVMVHTMKYVVVVSLLELNWIVFFHLQPSVHFCFLFALCSRSVSHMLNRPALLSFFSAGFAIVVAISDTTVGLMRVCGGGGGCSGMIGCTY